MSESYQKNLLEFLLIQPKKAEDKKETSNLFHVNTPSDVITGLVIPIRHTSVKKYNFIFSKSLEINQSFRRC